MTKSIDHGVNSDWYLNAVTVARWRLARMKLDEAKIESILHTVMDMCSLAHRRGYSDGLKAARAKGKA